MTTLLTRRPLLPTLLDDDQFDFPTLLTGEDGWSYPSRFFNTPAYVNMRVPSVNIKDNTRSYDLEMAVPGFKKSDLKVEVNEGVLSISSEKEKETEEERNGYTCREFNYNSFQRSFRLPENVEADKVKANFENGILKLSIPKTKTELKKNAKVIKID